MRNSSNSTQKSRYSSEDRSPTCVKFQENEVEIISKSSRAKVPGGLIPPERLAVPNKGISSNGNRKHSKSKGCRVPDAERNSGVNRGAGENGDQIGAGVCGTGSTSEAKPLVEWDSDERSEIIDFFMNVNYIFDFISF